MATSASLYSHIKLYITYANRLWYVNSIIKRCIEVVGAKLDSCCKAEFSIGFR